MSSSLASSYPVPTTKSKPGAGHSTARSRSAAPVYHTLRGWTPPSNALPPVFPMQEFDTSRAERTTIGHGYAFAQLFGHICRFSYERDAWYIYDSRTWVRDNGELMSRLRLEARGRYLDDAEALRRTAQQTPDDDTRAARLDAAKKFAGHVHATLGTPKALAMMVDAAKATMAPHGKLLDLSVRENAFDTHPHLLNCQNCVVDLRTGVPRPHDPALMLSKLAPVVYIADAQAPRFLQAIRRIMGGDMRRVRYLQRVLGYLLTGESRERKVIVFYGKTGSNGKSTISNILIRLVGQDFASGLPVSTLLAKRFGSDEIDVGLTSINGKRVVVAVEPNKGARFNTGVVKSLSGNDEAGVQARRPHQRELESVRPGAKILLLTNHLPLWEDDQAFNERFLIVPFDEVFRGKDEHQDLARELVEEEGPGILAWLVEGARLYYEHGLDVPSDIVEDGEARRLEDDLMGRWFADCCTLDAMAAAPVTQLYESYVWHLREVLRAPAADIVSLKAFSPALDRWSVSRERKRENGENAKMRVRGIRLRVGAGGEVLDAGEDEAAASDATHK